jgi:hypothetical protein
MGDDVFEAVECLKSRQRDGMIAATKEDVKAIEPMLDALCEEDLVFFFLFIHTRMKPI